MVLLLVLVVDNGIVIGVWCYSISNLLHLFILLVTPTVDLPVAEQFPPAHIYVIYMWYDHIQFPPPRYHPTRIYPTQPNPSTNSLLLLQGHWADKIENHQVRVFSPDALRLFCAWTPPIVMVVRCAVLLERGDHLGSVLLHILYVCASWIYLF